MTKHILKCSPCNIYTLSGQCPQCKEKTILPRPPKFSLEDKYALYRRNIKKEELKKKRLY